MKITLIVVGKIKEKYFVDAIAEYKKRLSRYATIKIVEVADEKTPDKANAGKEILVKEKEGSRILKYIKEESYVVSLAINGEMLNSENLSKKIENLGINGISHITFIIGGSLGLDDRVLKASNYLLSFSKMTFPHQMMRVILLEQIYRSYKIMTGEPYHK